MNCRARSACYNVAFDLGGSTDHPQIPLQRSSQLTPEISLSTIGKDRRDRQLFNMKCNKWWGKKEENNE